MAVKSPPSSSTTPFVRRLMFFIRGILVLQDMTRNPPVRPMGFARVTAYHSGNRSCTGTLLASQLQSSRLRLPSASSAVPLAHVHSSSRYPTTPRLHNGGTYFDCCPKQWEFSPLCGWGYAPLVVPVQERFHEWYAVTLVKPIGRTGG